MKSQNEQITINAAKLQAIKEKSEARRVAMCQVMEVIQFIFGEQGVPTSKAALIRRVTAAIMNSEALEAKLSNFSADNIDNYIKLTKKDENTDF